MSGIHTGATFSVCCTASSTWCHVRNAAEAERWKTFSNKVIPTKKRLIYINYKTLQWQRVLTFGKSFNQTWHTDLKEIDQTRQYLWLIGEGKCVLICHVQFGGVFYLRTFAAARCKVSPATCHSSFLRGVCPVLLRFLAGAPAPGVRVKSF